MKNRISIVAGLLIAAGAAMLGGCEKKTEAPAAPAAAAPKTAPATPAAPAAKAAEAAPAAKGEAPKAEARTTPAKKSYTIGIIAKSQSNPVFQAARTGAFEACADLSKKYGVEIKPNWQTPTSEDAQKQAQFIEQLVSQGVDGIAISCTDGNVLQRPIDDAVGKGVVVVTFDSDSPASKRMAYYGINDVDAGKKVMAELATAMGDKGGPIAVLAGNQTAPNLQARVRGVREQIDAMKDKGFKLKDVYYHKETAADAAAMVQQVQTANPEIAGWAMIGGWPLFTSNALNGVADKGVKVTAVDHLPQQLDYVKKGEVQALIGQDCYGWGYQSVVMIVEKLIENKTPANVITNFDLQVVKKENVGEFEGIWQKWLAEKK